MFEGWVKIMRPQMSIQQTMEIITILTPIVILKIKIFVKTYIIHGLISTQTHNIYSSRLINFTESVGRFSHIYVCFGFAIAHVNLMT